ncbi:histidine kinase [Agromyces protaetiae]|uniref:Histidine kinase n=1 Tax=Agromyces protaetiae TaxID=2509455 RepID=A0A4P6FE55_9MICO|nr:ATP-binding protein [Agromyces protaetiae]QAY74510.1 histidine kinase [Agromyces protaetiae]
MKRIHKERDRLLRHIARVAGLIGVGVALACLAVPGAFSGGRTLLATAALAAAAVLVYFANARGSLPLSIGVVAASIVAIVAVGTDDAPAPVAAVVVAATAGLAAPSVAIPLVVRRNGLAIVGTLAASVLATVWLLTFFGYRMLIPAVASVAGWSACTVLGRWLDRAISRTSERIDEVGRAHEAERLASELEAQQRQDARVLHDTVLATLSLLAHSGVGVGPGALRQQAGDDARLLRLLRLGAPLDSGGANALFSPDTGDDELGTTFESVRQRFARMGLDVNWHGAGQLALPRDTLDALLGALGECLENVRRHSGVNEADVTVTDDETTVRAMVSDAGNGFDTDGVDSARLGFAESVVGRLHSVGGRARVFSSPGAGTTVMLEVPKP